jgi:hypothetical protein
MNEISLVALGSILACVVYVFMRRRTSVVLRDVTHHKDKIKELDKEIADAEKEYNRLRDKYLSSRDPSSKK